VAKEGIAWEDNGTKGVPDKFDNLEQLVEFCTVIIFTGSAQHAAVNFGQFATYRFAPNAPLLMNLPPPKNNDDITLDNILASLPDATQASTVLLYIRILDSFASDNVYLGHFLAKLFVEEEARAVQAAFRDKCGILQSELEKRNLLLIENMHRSYSTLEPANVPNSIAI